MSKNKIIDLKNFDYILLLLVLVCVLYGIFSINSAVTSYDNSTSFVVIQSIAAFVGTIMMLIITLINYKVYGKITKVIYILCILFLVSVLLFGTGLEDTGSKSWIRFGPVGIQPSEIVKIGFIITFSKLCDEYGDKLNKPKNIFKLLIHAGILLALILLQPDFGTTMVFVVIMCGILFAAKISYKYILATVGCVSVAIPIVWNFFLQEYQKNRILVLLNPESDPLNAGYHVMQSKIALGSGGVVGKGIAQGTQTQLGYLPAKHTDFIFSVIGEEMGLIGCLIVTALLFALVLRCFYIAKNASDNFGSYICVGVGCMLLAHTFENIGMCVGVMPVTGIPLPFFSYGGSSILANLMAIGLVLSISLRRRTTYFD